MPREIEKLVQEICREEGIQCRPLAQGWMLMLSRGDARGFVFGYRFGVNASSAAAICADKAATSEVLTVHGIPNVAHTLFPPPEGDAAEVGASGSWRAMLHLLEAHATLVCKANEGTGGGDVYRVASAAALERVVQKIWSGNDAMAISPYEKIEREYRVVVLDGTVRIVYSKRIPTVTGDGRRTVAELAAAYLAGLPGAVRPELPLCAYREVPPVGEVRPLSWKHNLGQGARPELVEDEGLRGQLGTLALAAARAVGIAFASVDVIAVPDGLKVLEINDGVMMEHFARASEENARLAKELYRAAVSLTLQRGG